MNILLKPDVERFVAEKVSAGDFSDASALVNEAIEILRDKEMFSDDHKAYLKREIAHGLEQLDRGQFSDYDAETIIAEGRKRLAQNGKKT
jgi:antitoxin ParD1/3/4